MKLVYKLITLVLCCNFISSINASDPLPAVASDPLADVCWRKVTASSKEDIFACWWLQQSLFELKNSQREEDKTDKEYLKYLGVSDLGPFDVFYKDHIQEGILEPNELSGIYLCYLNKDASKPLGFIRIEPTLKDGVLEESFGFIREGERRPKRIGEKVMEQIKKLVEQYKGKPIDNTKEIFYGVKAGVDLENIRSLIVHVRAGMEPVKLVQKNNIKGAYFFYPPFDGTKKVYPDSLYEKTKHHRDVIQSLDLKSILEQVVKDEPTRTLGLTALKNLQIPPISANKDGCLSAKSENGYDEQGNNQ